MHDDPSSQHPLIPSSPLSFPSSFLLLRRPSQFSIFLPSFPLPSSYIPSFFLPSLRLIPASIDSFVKLPIVISLSSSVSSLLLFLLLSPLTLALLTYSSRISSPFNCYLSSPSNVSIIMCKESYYITILRAIHFEGYTNIFYKRTKRSCNPSS